MPGQPSNVAPYQGTARASPPALSSTTARKVIGDVAIGADASVWCGAVVRGDVNSIAIAPAATSRTFACCMSATRRRKTRKARRSSSASGHRGSQRYFARLHHRRRVPHRHGFRRHGRRRACAARIARRRQPGAEASAGGRLSLPGPAGQAGAPADAGRDRLLQLLREHYIRCSAVTADRRATQ